MRVIIRGIPDFSYTNIQEVRDLEEFVKTCSVRIRRTFQYSGEYHQADSNKRVSLYLEGVEENMELLRSRCFDDRQTTMKTCFIRIGADGRIGAAGTTSSIQTGQGIWYRIDPKLDPRYPAILAGVKEQEAKEARLAVIRQEEEDEMREEILDIADALGYEKALEILKGESK